MVKKKEEISEDSVNECPSKWLKIVQKMPEFKELADAADIAELKRIILTAESNIFTVEKEMESDAKLQGTKTLLKDYMEPFREAKKAQQAKIQYALWLLDNQGVNMSDKEE